MRMLTIALALLAATPALAQQNCAANPAVPGFAPGQAPMTDHLAPGPAVSLSLKPVRDVSYVPPLVRAPTPGSFGGVFPLEIKMAGTYHVALSGRVWIDVAQNGATVPATDHQYGAPCSGVAKIVAFKLSPGRYAVQLSDAEARAVTVKVTREAMIPVGK